MKTLLRELLYIFDRKKKIQALQLFFLTLVGAALEAIGIGVILPFVGLVIRPELIQEKESLQWLYHLTGADSHRIFLIYVTIGLFLVYLFKNSYLVFLYNLQYSFTFKSQETVSSRLFQIYLYNPYAFHMSRNSADLVKNLTGEMNALFNGVVRSGLTICTELIIFIVIIVLLFTVQPWTTLVAIIILGGAGLVFSTMVRKKLEKSGQIRQKDYGNMIKWVNQGIGSIKEIKVLNVESFFTGIFDNSCNAYCDASKVIALYSVLPRYFIETIVVTGILIIFVIITLGNDNPQNVIPVLSLFGIAAIRLMPSLNRMLAAVNTVRFYAPTVKTVYSDIYEFQNNEEIEKKRKQNNAYDSNRLPFYKSLEFKNVDYTYPEREEKVLNNISLIIPKASSVGFVGASGAGKTTLVNIMLGLLPPTEGSLFVDGQDIFLDLSAWQRMIGYVSQSVYLIDDTIRRNIAIGLPDNKIVEDKVWQVLRSVQLEDMVKNLPDGLDAVVGEQGMRLSGGQLQRVGIARALYRDPEVFIFDEATSSLDRETEASITEAIEGLGGEKTMIIIAHRMKTVENCDCLYFLEKGEITASGSYSELLEKSTEFKKMTGETN